MSKAKKKPAAKKPPPKPVRVYLVVRRAFSAGTYEGLSYGTPETDDGHPNDVPVRAFANKGDAMRFARELDDEIRRTFPPPLFGGEDDDDNAGPRIATAVAALGLPAFKGGVYNYLSGRRFGEWWAKHAADLSAEQKAALWEPFQGMTFHQVKQVEVEG